MLVDNLSEVIFSKERCPLDIIDTIGTRSQSIRYLALKKSTKDILAYFGNATTEQKKTKVRIFQFKEIRLTCRSSGILTARAGSCDTCVVHWYHKMVVNPLSSQIEVCPMPTNQPLCHGLYSLISPVPNILVYHKKFSFLLLHQHP